MRRIGTVGALFLCAPASAQGLSLQQEFDAAQARLELGSGRAALEAFERLLQRAPRSGSESSRRTVAQLNIGIGQARILTGDPRGALAAFEAAENSLPSETPSDRQTLAGLLHHIGSLQERQINYLEARKTLQRAIALRAFPPDGELALSAHLALARASIFDDPALAEQTLEAALPLIKPFPKERRRVALAEIYALRGRVYLNRGHDLAAYKWLGRALAADGAKDAVTIADIRVRGDLAIIAHRLGYEKEAQRYMAQSGIGRGGSDIAAGANMPLPACQPYSSIRSDDVAIVELAILPDGRVDRVTPVYASRPDVAAEFARAARLWSWSPEAAGRLDSFWRGAVRLEVRCTNAGMGPSLAAGIQPPADWHAKVAFDLPADLSQAELVPMLRRELEARSQASGPTSVAALPLLYALAQLTTLPDSERLEFATRAARIARSANSPLEAQVQYDLLPAFIKRRSDPVGAQQEARAVVAKLLSAGHGASAAAAYARLQLALMHQATSAERQQLLEQIVSSPLSALSASNPIRQTALLQLASAAAARGDSNEADRLFEETGLSRRQCAIANVQPARVRGTIGERDYPDVAFNFGFSGWAQVSYDIDTAGSPINPRTVLAYPPFIFGKASERNIQKLRFQPFPSGVGKTGCSDRLQVFRYRTLR